MKQSLTEIEVDLSSAFVYERGTGRSDLLELAARLLEAKVAVEAQFAALPEEAGPLLPPQVLAEYETSRKRSRLGQILSLAHRMRDEVDRVVVVGPSRLVEAARLLFAACCHPFHNELTRGERGGRPRMYFMPPNADNDAVQGLLDLLPQKKNLPDVDEQWGVIGIDGRAGCEDANDRAAAGRVVDAYFRLLVEACPATASGAALRRVIGVGCRDAPIMKLAEAAGAAQLELPNVVLGIDFFHPGIVLAASVMGLDVVRYLTGASAMFARCASQPVGKNAPLDLAGIRHLLKAKCGVEGLAVKSRLAALSPAAHRFSSQHGQQPFSVRLVAGGVRRDRLRVTIAAGAALGGRPRLKTVALTDIATQHEQAGLAERAAAGEGIGVIRLPTVDEASVGQLLALFSLSERILVHLEEH